MNKWIVILLGSIVWSLTMVKSGLIYSFGMGFWGPNGHDGIWHLALIENFANRNFGMPLFSGYSLQNYHLGYDIVMSLIHFITNIPSFLLYFQVTPPLIALAIGYLTYRFVIGFTKSSVVAWWSTFFVYFSGSFGWIFGGGESLFWAQQSISTLINPPYAVSLIIILLGMNSLIRGNLLQSVIFFTILPHMKIYAGLLSFSGLFFGGFKDRFYWRVLFFSLIITIPMYLLVNKSSQDLIVFYPGWFLESLFSPERLDIPRFFSALNTYRVGNIWVKAVPSYLVALAIFIIGNFGVRVISFVPLLLNLKRLKKITPIEIFLYSILFFGAVIPMLFIQKGTAWNTIQFFYYSLFIGSIYSGIAVSIIINKLKSSLILKFLFIVAICVLVIPTTFDTLKNYLPSRPPAKVSNFEIEALRYLRSQESGVVLSYPFDKSLADREINNPPRSLMYYETTAYISAFTGFPSYLADEVNLNITGYDWKNRREEVLKFFNETNGNLNLDFIHDNNIRYIYLSNEQASKLNTSGLIEVFSNIEIKIFKPKE